MLHENAPSLGEPGGTRKLATPGWHEGKDVESVETKKLANRTPHFVIS